VLRDVVDRDLLPGRYPVGEDQPGQVTGGAFDRGARIAARHALGQVGLEAAEVLRKDGKEMHSETGYKTVYSLPVLPPGASQICRKMPVLFAGIVRLLA